jgi:uncharacterized protein
MPDSWVSPKVEVRKSDIESKGVFAKENIKKGERVTIFGGSVMLIDEINNLPEEMQYYAFQIEERFVLGNKTSVPQDDDYFNHSCDPNVGFRGQIFLEAMRDIKKGEEITFDYAMTISESVGSDIVFEMECNCGSKNCRKIITENDWKNPQLRVKYKGFFSQYIEEKIQKEKK